jgi:hypothetical protein
MNTIQEENVISMFQVVTHSVRNKGVALYSKMPTKINKLKSLRTFKQRLNLFLLDHPFYLLNYFYI